MIHYWKVPHVSTPWDQLENVIVGLGALLNECLCIVYLDNDERDVEILVMKEYEVKKSWTSLFLVRNLEIDPWYDDLSPLIMTENEELILIIDGTFEKNILVYVFYPFTNFFWRENGFDHLKTVSKVLKKNQNNLKIYRVATWFL